jgi:partner of Y14 and mago protein
MPIRCKLRTREGRNWWCVYSSIWPGVRERSDCRTGRARTRAIDDEIVVVESAQFFLEPVHVFEEVPVHVGSERRRGHGHSLEAVDEAAVGAHGHVGHDVLERDELLDVDGGLILEGVACRGGVEVDDVGGAPGDAEMGGKGGAEGGLSCAGWAGDEDSVAHQDGLQLRHVEASSLSTTICGGDRARPAHTRAGHPGNQATGWIVRACCSLATRSYLPPSVRKQLKIRPGYTPQEDISRFRGTRQQAMDAAAPAKGHILGWVAPSSESQQKGSAPPPNKNARKRANQRAKKAAEAVKDSWEDEESSGTPASKTEPTRDEDEIADRLSKLTVK